MDLILGAARHSSLEQIFQVHVGSPVARFRAGVLRGPRIGDVDRSQQSSLIAIGIDGSVTLLKRCNAARWGALCAIQTYLSRGSHIGNSRYNVC